MDKFLVNTLYNAVPGAWAVGYLPTLLERGLAEEGAAEEAAELI